MQISHSSMKNLGFYHRFQIQIRRIENGSAKLRKNEVAAALPVGNFSKSVAYFLHKCFSNFLGSLS